MQNWVNEYFLVAVATLEMVQLVSQSVSQSVRVIVKKYSSFKDKYTNKTSTISKQHLNNTPTTPQHQQDFNNTPTILQKHPRNCIQEFINNCTTWCKPLHNIVKLTNFIDPQFSQYAVVFAKHGEITYKQHKQMHNMVKITNNCTAWCNSQTIAQHGKINKQLQNMVKSTNNCTTQ